MDSNFANRTRQRGVAVVTALLLTTLAVTWFIILVADVGHIRRIATREDPGRVLSFGFVVASALASVLAVVVLREVALCVLYKQGVDIDHMLEYLLVVRASTECYQSAGNDIDEAPGELAKCCGVAFPR